MPFLIRWLVNAAALWVATRLVPGVTYSGGWLPLLGVALVIFSFVVNGLMLWLTSALSGALGLGFHVDGFWAAFLGALVVSLVSMLLSMLVTERRYE